MGTEREQPADAEALMRPYSTAFAAQDEAWLPAILHADMLPLSAGFDPTARGLDDELEPEASPGEVA